jgi:hypothetical protein
MEPHFGFAPFLTRCKFVGSGRDTFSKQSILRKTRRIEAPQSGNALRHFQLFAGAPSHHRAGLREAAILEARPGNCFGNFRLNGISPNAYEGAVAMHIHTHRDESRSWHLDLIGGRVHPWSIDLVVVIVSGILLIGLACALAAHLVR